uniref:Cytokine like 1 n=1 Tax=Monopterus albus TaxID=43700 RepID=A0A3Q3PZ38_MONAL
MRLGLATLLCFLTCARLSACAPSTCYSRALALGKVVMGLVDRMHNNDNTKACVQYLPRIFIDVHNECLSTKLRDFVYLLLNHPDQDCRQLPRMVLLKRKAYVLYNIITRMCYRDLVYLSNDCEAIDTGRSSPQYAEDRLQILTKR